MKYRPTHWAQWPIYTTNWKIYSKSTKPSKLQIYILDTVTDINVYQLDLVPNSTQSPSVDYSIHFNKSYQFALCCRELNFGTLQLITWMWCSHFFCGMHKENIQSAGFLLKKWKGDTVQISIAICFVVGFELSSRNLSDKINNIKMFVSGRLW